MVSAATARTVAAGLSQRPEIPLAELGGHAVAGTRLIRRRLSPQPSVVGLVQLLEVLRIMVAELLANLLDRRLQQVPHVAHRIGLVELDSGGLRQPEDLMPDGIPRADQKAQRRIFRRALLDRDLLRCFTAAELLLPKRFGRPVRRAVAQCHHFQDSWICHWCFPFRVNARSASPNPQRQPVTSAAHARSSAAAPRPASPCYGTISPPPRVPLPRVPLGRSPGARGPGPHGSALAAAACRAPARSSGRSGNAPRPRPPRRDALPPRRATGGHKLHAPVPCRCRRASRRWLPRRPRRPAGRREGRLRRGR